MTETGRTYPKALRWKRSAGQRDAEVVVVDATPVAFRHVRHHLVLTNVRCTFDASGESVAATATAHLVLTNQCDHEIEYEVESVTVTFHQRVAEMTEPRAATIVDPGTASVIRCPSIRAVDRVGPSSGNIDYVIVYGHPDAPPAQRYRRQHGIWFRFEPSPDGGVQARFVERYDEDDPVA